MSVFDQAETMLKKKSGAGTGSVFDQAQAQLATASAESPEEASLRYAHAITPVPMTKPPFASRVAERIYSNFAQPFQILDKFIEEQQNPKTAFRIKQVLEGGNKDFHKQLYPWGESLSGRVAGSATFGPRLMLEQIRSLAKDWSSDPAKMVGDLLALELSRRAGGVKVPEEGQRLYGKAPKQPEFPTLSPEQQVRYTAAIDKVNEAFSGKLSEYHEKLNAAFDEAKRLQLEARTNEHAKYAADVHKYLQDMTKMFDEGKRAQIEAEAAHQQETTKIQTENAEKQAEYERKLAEHGRRGRLTAYQERFGKIIMGMLDRTHQRVLNTLNSRWENLRAINKSEVLDSRRVKNGFEKARAELSGVPDDLKLFNQIIDNVSSDKDMVSPEGGGAAEPRLRPMTWQEGRRAYTALMDAWSNASGNLRRAIKVAVEPLDQELLSATGRTNSLREYLRLKSDWGQYLSDWKDARQLEGSPIARLMKVKDSPIMVDKIAGGKTSARMFSILERYRKFGASPEPFKGLIEAGKKATELQRKSPAPPNLGEVPEKPFTVPEFLKVPGAPELPSEMGKLEAVEGPKRMPKPPTLKKVPRPEPRAIKHPTRISKTIARATGAIVGAKTIPIHPIAGSRVGAEAAGTLEELLRGGK